jgi:hypothetical protein
MKHIHQSDVGIMDQRRGLQRLPRFLLSQLGGSQFPELTVRVEATALSLRSSGLCVPTQNK